MRKLQSSILIAASILAPGYGRTTAADAATLFEVARTFAIDEVSLHLAIGDLNRDGKADLATSNSLLLGNGDGTFQAKVDFGAGNNAGPPVVGDLNGDSNQDIVTSSLATVGAASVFLGNGDGTFRSPTNYGSGPSIVEFLAVGDLNGDGKPDLVTVNGSTASVLLGGGDGTFGAPVTYVAGNPLCVVIADVNRDEKQDLVTAGVADTGNITYSVLVGNGDGSFNPPTVHPLNRKMPASQEQRSRRLLKSTPFHGSGSATESFFGNFLSLAGSDLNADGTPDLVIAPDATQNDSAVLVFLGNGDGTFQTHVDYKTLDYLSGVAIGDVNADGRPDIVTANDYSATVSVLAGVGDGTFRPRENFGVGGGATLDVVIGDLSGDGKPDLATSKFGQLSVLLSNGDGTFQATRDYSVGRNPFSTTIGDLDGDGKLDVATANWDESNISVLYGNGDGSLQDRVDLPSTFNPIMVSSADLNGDGRSDLVVLNDYGEVSVFLSGASRTFQPRVDYAVPARSFVLGDVNGDQKADLVTADGALLGNGDGTFGTRVDYTTSMNVISLAMGDLNGDLRGDLVTTNLTSTTSVVLGNGDGTFQPPVEYGTGITTYPVAIGDLNGDGKPDLVTGSFSTGGVSVLLGNGDGTFQTKVDYAVGRGYRALAIRDLDGDGKPDLAAVSNSGTISVLLGLGNGAFGAPVDYAAGRGPFDLAVGDLNRDGKPDIVVSNSGSYTVSVLLNAGTGVSALSAEVDFDPGVINLHNQAKWVTAFIEPSGFSPGDIDFSTLRLNGDVAPAPKFAKVLDHDRDGRPELMVRFSRASLDPHLALGMNNLEVTGLLVTGASFNGTDAVRVQSPGRSKRHVSVSPNPLNPEGRLSFYVDKSGPVKVRVFDRGGRLVRTVLDVSAMEAGPHQLTIDGRGDRGARMASGVYFYRVETPDGIAAGRFTVLK